MAPSRRRLSWLILPLLAAVRAAESSLEALFATEHLAPLTSAAQLPQVEIDDLIEVFTLSTEVVLTDSLLAPAAVTMEHYALAFRPQAVSWSEAKRGDRVTSARYLPRNASALLGLPVFSGPNGTGAAVWPDARAAVMVSDRFDYGLWRDADYVGTVGGAAFARLSAELPKYADARGDFYAAFEVYGAPPSNDEAFVQWCLDRLAKHGATLTPLMRPERRRLALSAKASPTAVARASAEGLLGAFATSLRACVLSTSADGLGEASRRPLRGLAARDAAPLAEAPLAACLADLGDALYAGADGVTARVALEAPYLTYDAYEPRVDEPADVGDKESYDRTWVDALLVVVIALGALFGAFKLTAKTGFFAAACAPPAPRRAVGSPRGAGEGEGDDLYARLQSPTSREPHSTELMATRAPATPPTAGSYRDRPADGSAVGFV